MSHTIYDSTFVDRNGNRLMLSDNVTKAFMYDTSSETWDKAGGGTASWFLEPTMPNDMFLSGLDDTKWGIYNTAGAGASVTVDGGVTFSVVDSSGEISISSNGKWSLSGDFSLDIGVGNDGFYDEYRSSVSFGLTVKIDTMHLVRIAKVVNYNDSSAKYQALYADGTDPTMFGWSSLSSSRSVISPKIFSINRIGDTLSCKVDGNVIGEVSGESWSGDATVSIGVESPQQNSVSATASFFCASGTLTTPELFISQYRGPSQNFPDTSLFLVDDYGMSIVDYDNKELWARFRANSGSMLTDVSSGVTAIAGSIYISNTDGLSVVDLVDDTAYKFNTGGASVSSAGVSSRNGDISYTVYDSSASIPSNSVYDVFVRELGGHEYVALATASGVSLITDRSSVVNCYDGVSPAKKVYISDVGKLLWSGYGQNNVADLSYYSDVGNFITFSGSEFSRTGYYGVDSPSCSFSSKSVNDISAVYSGGREYIALATDDGVSLLVTPPFYSSCSYTYGIPLEENFISDPVFSNNLGDSDWVCFSDSVVFTCATSTVDDWGIGDSRSLEFVCGNGGVFYISAGDFSGVYQEVNLSGLGRIYFDVRVVGPVEDDGRWFIGQFKLVVAVNSDVLAEYEEIGVLGDEVYESQYIDVSEYSGVNTIYLYLISLRDDITYVPFKRFLISNLRAASYVVDSEIIGGEEKSVENVFLDIGLTSKKIYYAKRDGYGVIDITTDSSDYFVSSKSVSTDTTVNGGTFYVSSSV